MDSGEARLTVIELKSFLNCDSCLKAILFLYELRTKTVSFWLAVLIQN